MGSYLHARQLRNRLHPNPSSNSQMSALEDLLKWNRLQQRKLARICDPLTILGINFFHYAKVRENGDYIFLSNRPDWEAHYISHYFADDLQYKLHPQHVSGGVELWKNQRNILQRKIFRDAAQLFDLHNGIIIICKQPTEYELFVFAAPKNNKKIYDLYLNHFVLIREFIRYFKNSNQKFLRKTQLHRVKLQEIIGNQFYHKMPRYRLTVKEQKNFLERINPDALSGKSMTLTKRQQDCAHWLIEGKTAEETSVILNLSKRTVEYYIAIMKRKLDCNSRSELIAKLVAVDTFAATPRRPAS